MRKWARDGGPGVAVDFGPSPESRKELHKKAFVCVPIAVNKPLVCHLGFGFILGGVLLGFVFAFPVLGSETKASCKASAGPLNSILRP